MRREQADCILDSTFLCPELYAFARKEFAVENIDFLLLVRIANNKFVGGYPANNFPANVTSAADRANYIYKRFVKPPPEKDRKAGDPEDQEINLPADIRDALKALYDAGKLEPVSFQTQSQKDVGGKLEDVKSAYEEICRLVGKDTAERFSKTPQYAAAAAKDKNYLAKVAMIKGPEFDSPENWNFAGNKVTDQAGKVVKTGPVFHPPRQMPLPPTVIHLPKKKP